MRIVMVNNKYRSAQPSGENLAVAQEIELLTSAGHSVHLYERQSDDIQDLPLLEVAALPLRTVWSTEDRRRLRAMLIDVRPDVVHVHNTFPLISPSVLGGCAEAGVPVVATLHNFRLVCANGLLFRDGNICERCVGRRPWPAVMHACYRQSRAATIPVAVNIMVHETLRTWHRNVSAFVVLSGFAREIFMRAGLPGHLLHVKPNFVNRPDRRREDHGRHFVFLGRLSHEKGVDLLLDAWSPELGELIIVGDGPARSDLEARSAQARATVRFLGQQSRERCRTLLREARALIVPSRWYEGFPLVVAEAYALGIPVIAPDHGPFPEIIVDGKTGLLFAPGDRSQLADRMQELAIPEVSERMGLAAAACYERRYTPERNLAELIEIYERAIAVGVPVATPA